MNTQMPLLGQVQPMAAETSAPKSSRNKSSKGKKSADTVPIFLRSKCPFRSSVSS